MTNADFKKLVVSKVKPGPFQPVVTYNPNDDSLEVVFSDETYRTQALEGARLCIAYVGRESGDVIGIRIGGTSSARCRLGTDNGPKADLAG